MDSILDRWRPHYQRRGAEVESRLANVFQEAFSHERPGDLVRNQGLSASVTHLRTQGPWAEPRLLLFLYSGHYDPELAESLFAGDDSLAEEPLTPREILERKRDRLETNFEPFVALADHAGCYVCALLQGRHGVDLPLVWDVPVPDEDSTGIPGHIMWWFSFQYLCEVATGIVAYGGVSGAFLDELAYIRGEDHLRSRLLWLDQELVLRFPDEEGPEWHADQIRDVLEELERRNG